MSRTGTCPICEWPIRQHRRCPVCGWELESEELLLSDPALLKEFQRKLNKTRKQWREAAEAYRAGRLGFGEEAVQRLRRRLQEQGFHPGPAFSKWARPHAPLPPPPPAPPQPREEERPPPPPPPPQPRQEERPPPPRPLPPAPPRPPLVRRVGSLLKIPAAAILAAAALFLLFRVILWIGSMAWGLLSHLARAWEGLQRSVPGGGWGVLLALALIALSPWLLPRAWPLLEALSELMWSLLKILAAVALAAAAVFLLFRAGLWIGAMARELPSRLARAWEGLPRALPAPGGAPAIPRPLLPIACVQGDQGLRASPGGAIQSRLAHGTPVWILEEGSAWSRARTPQGAVGYLPAKALKQAPRTAQPITCVQATEHLRLRAGPGTGFKILERVEPATPLEVLGREGEWIQVRTPEGRTGFVATRWVFWPPLDPAAGP